MRFVLFYHTLVSDWNHGNAHFLRGIVWELQARGHHVRVFEPKGNWSLTNLRRDHGDFPVAEFHRVYPGLRSIPYELETIDLDEVLSGADVAIVHEWNEPDLVARIGAHRNRRGEYRLLFHDTHHRCVTDSKSMAAYDLSRYDGVLAYGRTLRDVYVSRGWAGRVWIWHEAADTRLFQPIGRFKREGDLVWIGNWGDEERTAELWEFLLEPVKALGLKARVYGVRYPDKALRALAKAGVEYGGWLPNYRVPEVFACFRLTVHIPRRPYVEELPGIPNIRPFEALACGTPLVSSYWNDTEGLFHPGSDFLVARSGAEMECHLRMLLRHPEQAQALAASGLKTIRQRHTCSHRVDELLAILREMDPGFPPLLQDAG